MTPNTVLSFIASLIHLRRPRRRSSRPGFHTTWRFAWPMVVNRQLPRLSAEAPSELHLNSAHLTSLARRAALVSVSDASGPSSDPGATDNCPVLPGTERPHRDIPCAYTRSSRTRGTTCVPYSSILVMRA